MLSGERSGDVLADRRFALAQQLFERGDIEASTDLVIQARELAPSWAPFSFRLGELFVTLGRNVEAIEAFNAYLALDPADSMGAIIKLSLLGAEASPGTLPPAYVEALFDEYAPRFDRALVERLDYRVPGLLAHAVDSARPFSGQLVRVLDLGCGTGLGGEVFVPRADWLEGVDLSAAMLAQAEAKGIYHHLAHVDLTDFLKGDHEPYGIVLAADVLTYMGALDQIFAGVARAIAPGGLFAFSVQKFDGENFALGEDHRYSHSRAYIEQCAREAGFEIVSIEDAVLRKDGGHDVNGLICVLSMTGFMNVVFWTVRNKKL